jgi:hypothetical protein
VQLLDQPDAYSVLASGSLAGGAPGGAYDVVVTQLANGSIAATVNGELLATSHVALPADAIGGGLAVHANQVGHCPSFFFSFFFLFCLPYPVARGLR